MKDCGVPSNVGPHVPLCPTCDVPLYEEQDAQQYSTSLGGLVLVRTRSCPECEYVEKLPQRKKARW